MSPPLPRSQIPRGVAARTPGVPSYPLVLVDEVATAGPQTVSVEIAVGRDRSRGYGGFPHLAVLPGRRSAGVPAQAPSGPTLAERTGHHRPAVRAEGVLLPVLLSLAGAGQRRPVRWAARADAPAAGSAGAA